MKNSALIVAVLALFLTLRGQVAHAGTLLFQDTFTTDNNPNGDGWYDVNHHYTLRQSGLLAPRTYLENPNTAAGGAHDYATQVNNPGLGQTLLLANTVSNGQTFTWVSPNQNFLNSHYLQQTIQVAVDPFGPGSSPLGNHSHYAAVVFGMDAGHSLLGPGTGVRISDSGGFAVFDNYTLVDTGGVGAKTSPTQFYNIVFNVNLGNGEFSVSIDGNLVFSGDHIGGAYSTDFVTLEDLATRMALAVPATR